MNKVLIVIDAQEDFTRGALRNEEAIAALPKICEIVQCARDNDFKRIIFTADTHEENYLDTQEGRNLPVRHCIFGTDGWKICPEVGFKDGEDILIAKPAFGTLSWDDIRGLDDVDEIWMCGFCTDICVSANFQILKAAHKEVPIVVIEDACAGVTPELHEAALKVMKSCQAYVVKWGDSKN